MLFWCGLGNGAESSARLLFGTVAEVGSLTWRTQIPAGVGHDDGLVLALVVQAHGFAVAKGHALGTLQLAHSTVLTGRVGNGPADVYLEDAGVSGHLEDGKKPF